MNPAFSRRTGLRALAAAVVTGTVATTAPAALAKTAQHAPAVPAGADGFRVLPYLMEPTATSMDLVWFSERPVAGTVVVSGPGLGNNHGNGRTRPAGTRVSAPELQPLLAYTQKELTQTLTGLPQGSWLLGAENWKHRVSLAGLKPGKEYTYTVTQGGRRHTASFRTADDGRDWSDLRLIAFSDTETEPYGRIENREWELSQVTPYTEGSLPRPGEGSLWQQTFGSTVRYGAFTLKYPLTQDVGLRENIAHIDAADPDLLLVAGDLGQGSAYQPGWDEFFRHVAGEHSDIASRVPLITALGNWETFAALNGGYGTPADRSPVVRSRNKYHAYFERTGAGTDRQNPRFRGSYYRTDHGPLTIITLDSTNGVPDESVNGPLSGAPISGDDRGLTAATMPTDTQGSFTQAEYEAAFPKVFPGSTPADADLPVFNPGHAQWAWAEEQLADARAKGQIILVEFHHVPLSIGEHGTPPNHAVPDDQSGVAMRVYAPLLEKHGVAVVISGHDEMFQRSWVDADGDGVGFHSYDVGVASDGLRGEKYAKNAAGEYEPVRFNTHMEWTANTHEPETWADVDGVRQLVDGGMHYGHLQIDLKRRGQSAEMTLTPMYVFPILDSQYRLVRTERRAYGDVQLIRFDRNGVPLPRR
ncbi:metallophosphoesterase [Micrococcus porci]|uniref:metallophosphoesterase n=1 Tax=Micrococcus porci TaxID=2856555 RepID=UPI001CCC25D1|nr:metallophosphoesterase [Micrococcus porci]UBH24705.1 metallophosphoesterase [Micrococcus porci]